MSKYTDLSKRVRVLEDKTDILWVAVLGDRYNLSNWIHYSEAFREVVEELTGTITPNGKLDMIADYLKISFVEVPPKPAPAKTKIVKKEQL